MGTGHLGRRRDRTHRRDRRRAPVATDERDTNEDAEDEPPAHEELAEPTDWLPPTEQAALPRSIDLARRDLDESFSRRRRSFELPLDLREVLPFTAAVLRELARIPYGETETYGELGAPVSRPRAGRAVGAVMNRNRIPIVLPRHRVVASSGSLAG